MQEKVKKTWHNHKKYRDRDAAETLSANIQQSHPDWPEHMNAWQAFESLQNGVVEEGNESGYGTEYEDDWDVEMNEVRRKCTFSSKSSLMSTLKHVGTFLQDTIRSPEDILQCSARQDAQDASTASWAPTSIAASNGGNTDDPEDLCSDSDSSSDSSSESDSEGDLEPIATLNDLKIALSYVQWIKDARHEDTGMKDDEIQRLLNPPKCLLDLSNNPDLELCIGLYVDLTKTSQKEYDSAMARLRSHFAKHHARYPDLEPTTFYTYAQVRSAIRELTGVIVLKHNMCIKSCMAYTGPLKDLQDCLECEEARYQTIKGKDVPRQQFYTIPVGPQIQAALRSEETGSLIGYRATETKKVIDEYITKCPDGTYEINLPGWGDYIHGKDYLLAVLSEDIRDDDLVLMLSVNGAQLYEMKKSDCWIYIWVLMDLPPQYRYKKKYVMPGGFIPGPNKPKNLQSFIFPGL
jgi:hypothetical protein